MDIVDVTYSGNQSSGKTTRFAPLLATSSMSFTLATAALMSNFTSVWFLFINGMGQFAGSVRTIAIVRLL